MENTPEDQSSLPSQFLLHSAFCNVKNSGPWGAPKIIIFWLQIAYSTIVARANRLWRGVNHTYFLIQGWRRGHASCIFKSPEEQKKDHRKRNDIYRNFRWKIRLKISPACFRNSCCTVPFVTSKT